MFIRKPLAPKRFKFLGFKGGLFSAGKAKYDLLDKTLTLAPESNRNVTAKLLSLHDIYQQGAIKV